MTSTVALLTPLLYLIRLVVTNGCCAAARECGWAERRVNRSGIGFQPFRDRYTLYNNYRAQPAPGGSAGRIMHNVPGDQSKTVTAGDAAVHTLLRVGPRSKPALQGPGLSAEAAPRSYPYSITSLATGQGGHSQIRTDVPRGG